MKETNSLQQRDRCLKVAKSFLEDKSVSVAVDNTNADEQTRKHWINLAQSLNVPIRCVLFTASASLAQHNDIVRGLNDSSVSFSVD
jgi:bifunctional polynucleotide phosphatase/kinase